jgi:hypothetical protein
MAIEASSSPDDDPCAMCEGTRAALEASLRALREHRAAIDARIKALVVVLTMFAPSLDPEPVRYPSNGLRDEAYDLMAALDRPIHFRRVVDMLATRGIRPNGKDPGLTLNAHLSRDPRFANVGRGLWRAVPAERRDE